MSRIRCLPLAFIALLLLAADRAEAHAYSQVQGMSGIVVDSGGTPMAGVEVSLLRDSVSAIIVRKTHSLADGTFSFENVARGPAYLRVRRLGYHINVTALRTDTLAAGRPIRITMHTAALELGAVQIDAKSSVMKDFEERRRKRGTGHFIDRAEIERRRPAYASEILAYFPGNSLRQSNRGGGNQSRVRGCKPSIWLDGIQAYGAELDEVVRVGDIDGMEIYSSWSAVPAQFGNRGDRSCGAILVWTRR